MGIKKHLILMTIILLLLAGRVNAGGNDREIINTGPWTIDELNILIFKASKIKDSAERIAFISRQFLSLPYQEKTLVGGVQTPEVLTINLAEVDCFTLLDYVEAMRLSASFEDFKSTLKKIRYRSGVVDYQHRNHFFTDWIEFNSDLVTDVTEQIGADKMKKALKMLNGRVNNKQLLPNVPIRNREITYIPTKVLNVQVISKLKTGDYVGIYSDRPNLDVTHVGIVIRDGNRLLFRHASSASRHKKVIDEDFKNYVSGTSGIVVLRPKPAQKE